MVDVFLEDGQPTQLQMSIEEFQQSPYCVVKVKHKKYKKYKKRKKKDEKGAE